MNSPAASQSDWQRRAVKDIQIGDMVRLQDSHREKSAKPVEGTVIDLPFESQATPGEWIFLLKLKPTGRYARLVSTFEPVYVAVKTRLFAPTTLEALKVGDVVRMTDRDHVEFEGTVIKPAEPDVFRGYLLIVLRGDVVRYMHLPKDAPVSVFLNDQH